MVSLLDSRVTDGGQQPNSESQQNTEFPKVSNDLELSPAKSKEPTTPNKMNNDKPTITPPQEKSLVLSYSENTKIEPEEFEITEEVFEKLSELDKLVFGKLREEYQKIAKLPVDDKENIPKPRKDAGYLINLIKAYIQMSTLTASTEDPLLKSHERDGESESKEGSNKERKFELFNQRYKVALAPQSSLYKGIQARRARSANKNLARQMVIGVQSDKSYSHTSK